MRTRPWIRPPGAGAGNVIHITYSQTQLPNGMFTMFLVLQSSFPRPLAYHASAAHAMRPFDPFSTSTCPVYPGSSASEAWPDPLWSLSLRNFRTAETPRLCKIY
jgi:hypothetical protein